MQGLHPIDIAVIVLYLVGITALGIWMARRVKQVSDFFMPRRFGKGMMIMHAFGTGTASDQAVTVASATFRGGLSGIWYQWLWLFVTPFYWLIAPIFRRFRAITTADVYELRFDQSVAVLFALVGIANMCIKIGLMLKGASVLIESGTGGMIDTNVAIIALTTMFVTYGAAGGLAAMEKHNREKAAILYDMIDGEIANCARMIDLLDNPLAPLLVTGEEEAYTLPKNVPELLAKKIEVMKAHRHEVEDIFPDVGEWNFDEPTYSKSGEMITAEEAELDD